MFNTRVYSGQIIITGSKIMCDNHLEELFKIRKEEQEKIIEEEKQKEKITSESPKCSNYEKKSNNNHQENIDSQTMKEYMHKIELYESKFAQLKKDNDKLNNEKADLVEKLKESNIHIERYKNSLSK